VYIAVTCVDDTSRLDASKDTTTGPLRGLAKRVPDGNMVGFYLLNLLIVIEFHRRPIVDTAEFQRRAARWTKRKESVSNQFVRRKANASKSCQVVILMFTYSS